MTAQMTVARPPVLPSRAPTGQVPDGACDTHLHIFGETDRFPLAAGTTEAPAPGNLRDWVSRLKAHFDRLGLTRGVIVHSVVYAEDNSLTAEAMRLLGADAFRGVALVRPDITERELDELHGAGFRGVRLNLSFTGALTLDGLEALAPRLAARNWHVLVNLPRYVGLDLSEILDRLTALPLRVVLDHYGYPDLEAGPKAAGFERVLRLLESGRIWVKLSASYRQCAAPYTALDPFVQAMVATNPDALLWASDWPHVRWSGAMPDNATQLDALFRQVPEAAHRRRILVDNAARLYGFG